MKKLSISLCLFFLYNSNVFAETLYSKIPTKVALTRGAAGAPYIAIDETNSNALDFGAINIRDNKSGIIKMNPENGALTLEHGNIQIPETGSLGHFVIKGHNLLENTNVHISFESANLTNDFDDSKILLTNIISKEIEENGGSIYLQKQDNSNSGDTTFTTAGTLEIPENLSAGDYSGYYTINFSY